MVTILKWQAFNPSPTRGLYRHRGYLIERGDGDRQGFNNRRDRWYYWPQDQVKEAHGMGYPTIGDAKDAINELIGRGWDIPE